MMMILTLQSIYWWDYHNHMKNTKQQRLWSSVSTGNYCSTGLHFRKGKKEKEKEKNKTWWIKCSLLRIFYCILVFIDIFQTIELKNEETKTDKYF